MGADGQVGLITSQESNERIGVEPVERLPDRIVVLFGVVQIVIQPAQNLRGFVNQVDIRFRIKVSKYLICIFEHIHMLNFSCNAPNEDCLLDRFRRPEMPRSRTRRKHQNSPEHDQPAFPLIEGKKMIRPEVGPECGNSVYRTASIVQAFEGLVNSAKTNDDRMWHHTNNDDTSQVLTSAQRNAALDQWV